MSASSYYYKPKRDPVERAVKDTTLRDLLEKIHVEFPTYGYRRLYWQLRLLGMRVNQKGIRRVMYEYGLRPILWRAFRISTTDSNHSYQIYPNLLRGRSVNGINQVWVSDITHVRIQTCFIYVVVILDIYSRKVIGWAISKRIDHELCLTALKMALSVRRPPPGCIHHSDRGVQYSCDKYVDTLKEDLLRRFTTQKDCIHRSDTDHRSNSKGNY